MGAGEKSAAAGAGPGCVSGDIHESLCRDVHVNDCRLLQVNLWVCVGARGKGGAKCRVLVQRPVILSLARKRKRIRAGTRDGRWGGMEGVW